MKDWFEPNSICNIQVFLSFANFYQQLIQSFNKIAALFIYILKTTGSPNVLASGKNSVEDVIIRFSNNDEKPVKKPGKLREKKLSKSQKLAKSGKKL